MNRLIALVVGVLLLLAAFYGAVLLASESGEVVTLRTRNAADAPRDTRLWLVESEGAEWVRTGHPDKGWFVRLLANPEVELLRGDERSRRIAVPVRDPAVARQVNRAFAEKYGAADWIVALSGDASSRIPVRLDRVPE